MLQSTAFETRCSLIHILYTQQYHETTLINLRRGRKAKDTPARPHTLSCSKTPLTPLTPGQVAGPVSKWTGGTAEVRPPSTAVAQDHTYDSITIVQSNPCVVKQKTGM